MDFNKMDHHDKGIWRWLLGGALALALIVSSVWIVMDRDKEPLTEDLSSMHTSTPKPTAVPTAKPTATPTVRPTESPSITPEVPDEETEEATPTPNVNQVGTEVAVSFSTPLFGHISKEYAMDHLLYSVTMDYWHTHSGVDIEANLGTAVKSAADGVVTKAEKDPSMGYTIEIDHGNGWLSRYCNLAQMDTVYVGQVVKSGTVIGTVGESAALEYAEATHLHFELYKDGKTKDPTEYLVGLNK